MQIKYIVIDESDAYHSSVREYTDKEKMLEAIQYKDISGIKVYEIAKRVRLENRPAIIESD
jgi:hypothetical protein